LKIDMVTTAERMVKIETKMDSIESKMDDHIYEQRKDFDKVTNLLESMDGKFASKWVEKGIIALSVMISAGMVTIIVQSIIG